MRFDGVKRTDLGRQYFLPQEHFVMAGNCLQQDKQ